MPKPCAFFEECHTNACVKIRHTGECLCRQHFVKNIEKRAAETISRYKMLPDEPVDGKPEHWIIGMSGGKDSQALAHVLVAIYGNKNPRVRFSGLYIDVGVTGNHYTDESREIVRRTCDKLGIPCVVIDIKKDFGVDMDDFHVLSQCKKGAKRAECSNCGIIKRYLINREAARMGGDKVATGHHLTDESNMILNNFFNISVEQMARAQPWEKLSVEGAEGSDNVLLPRVKPFLEVTEEETTMYVRYAELEYVATQCPYAANATTSALKKHMIALEMERPGTMLRLVRGFHENFLPVLRPANATAQKAAAAAKLLKKQKRDGAAAAEAAATPGGTPGDKKFEVKKWNAVALWSWDLDVEMCAICRNNIMEPCIECQSKSADATGDCNVAWGTCGHAFHFHCIDR